MQPVLSMLATLLPVLAGGRELTPVDNTTDMVAAAPVPVAEGSRADVTRPDSDDAVRAAVANGAGKTVKFAPGRYNIGTPISPGADTTVTCDGLCEFVPAAGFTGAAIQVRAHHVIVSGLTFTKFKQAFDVNGVSGFTAQANHIVSATGPGLGVISNSSGVRILDNTVESAMAISISLHDNTDVIVARNTIANGGDDAIAVRALAKTNNDMTVIANNFIEDAGKAGIKLTVESLYSPGIGMGSVAGAQNMRAVIEGNLIKRWGRKVAESAITIDNHLLSGEMNQLISIASNTIQSENRPNELRYISATNVKDVAIIGNVMRGGVSASGIATQRSSYLTINGNVVADACKRAANADTGGISLLTTNYSTVQGNTIRNPGNNTNNRPGILAQQSQYNAIVGNVIVDDLGTHTMSYGIEMSSVGAIKSDFNTVVGNVSTGHVAAALTWGGSQRSQSAMTNVGDWKKQHISFTFTSGATARVMAHSLGATPARVYGTPRGDLGSATKWWVDSCTPSACVIQVDRDPRVNVNFNIEVGYGSE